MSDNLFSSQRPPSAPPPAPTLKLSTLLPWFLALGWGVTAIFFLAPHFRSALDVQVRPVVVMQKNSDHKGSHGSSDKTSSAVKSPTVDWNGPKAFQASGWIEPYPQAVMATALTDGVIREVHVLEGQDVSKGELLATLIQEDHQLRLQRAKAQLKAREAQLEEQEFRLQRHQAELKSLEQSVNVADAELDITQDKAQRLQRVFPHGVSKEDLNQSKLQVKKAQAQREQRHAQWEELKALKFEIEAQLQRTQAQVESAQVDLREAELALSRTEIRSPMDGRVLKLFAQVGQRKMSNMDQVNASTIAQLYSPFRLQARIDVPLSEAAKVFIGQKVLMHSQLLSERSFKGEVIRFEGHADLQRNTLQVKVKLLEVDDRLRPDMLCRAEFLSPQSQSESKGPIRATHQAQQLSIWVPTAALLNPSSTNPSQAEVWVLDPRGESVHRRAVTFMDRSGEDHLEVLSGLRPGEQVVISPPPQLEEGRRIKVSPLSAQRLEATP